MKRVTQAGVAFRERKRDEGRIAPMTLPEGSQKPQGEAKFDKTLRG
jgi:hypothetical protein